MPKIYRAMEAADELPVVGSQGNMLGVRTPPNERADIRPDTNGEVAPSAGGMSVNPGISAMPSWAKPKRWRREHPELHRDARGQESVEVFTHGAGAFVAGRVADELVLAPDSHRHGMVEPARTMSIDEYRAALAATRPGWRILRDPDGS
jgi:hypothetical protein